MALKISVDIERMTIGDLELLDRAGRNELPVPELIDFLDRIVVEDVRALPFTALTQITDELRKAVEAMANPQDEGGENLK